MPWPMIVFLRFLTNSEFKRCDDNVEFKFTIYFLKTVEK